MFTWDERAIVSMGGDPENGVPGDVDGLPITTPYVFQSAQPPLDFFSEQPVLGVPLSVTSVSPAPSATAHSASTSTGSEEGVVLEASSSEASSEGAGSTKGEPVGPEGLSGEVDRKGLPSHPAPHGEPIARLGSGPGVADHEPAEAGAGVGADDIADHGTGPDVADHEPEAEADYTKE